MKLCWKLCLALTGVVAGAAPLEMPYGPLQRQRMDVYRTAATNAPVLIYVHGGAWISGTKEDYAVLGERFQKLGLTTVVIDYRLAGGDNPVRYPEPVRDAALAVEYVTAHAGEWNSDPKRVFVVGHSAGAHIAGVLATDKEFKAEAEKIAGFVGLEGIYDVPALVKRWPSYRDWFVTLAFGAPSQWKKASPQYVKPSGKNPWLVVHSTQDELVDENQSKAFAAHLKKSHLKVKLDLRSRQSHFGVVEELQRSSPLQRALLDFVGS